MIRRPPRSTRTDTLFPTRRSSDLAMRKRFFVPVVIALARRRTQAGRLADTLFVFGPQFLGPHERLVVEPGWNEARKSLQKRQTVIFDVGRRIHAGSHQFAVELDFSGTRIGHRMRAFTELNNVVGLFDTSRHNTGVTMVYLFTRHTVQPF